MLSLLSKSLNVLRPVSCRVISTTSVNPAARKGTREKARKKKVKKEIIKYEFVPHNERKLLKSNIKRENLHKDDSWKQVSNDNVYIGKYYRYPVYPLTEAIEAHKETHHPTMYNLPDAPLLVNVELNMQGEKKTRFVDNFTRLALVPHNFRHGESREILFFGKGQEIVAQAQKAGASLAGGSELIKDIQNGKLDLVNYQFVLAHPNIMAELVTLRGVMKRKFPSPKNLTLGDNVTEMVQRFLNGVQYRAEKNQFQQDFGLITAVVGTLDMPTKHLEENTVEFIKDVSSMRPKRNGTFITKVLLSSPPSKERLKIDPFLYVEEIFEKKGGKKEETFEEFVEEKAEAVAS